MQGRKDFTPQLFYELSLDRSVPADNFYRRVNQELDLHFLYQSTKKYYGTEGQQSIDPVVFFKILLVGYLNNINSDRALIRYCSNCLDVRLFLGYDLNEELPWHSTISRTRGLFGEEIFLNLFKKILKMCVSKGMVRGKRQAVDSVFIKANASNLIRPKYLSNHTHYSPTDKDSRVNVKPGKARQLNYFGQIAVDDAHHVITGACSDFADKRDSQCLEQIVELTQENLGENEIDLEELLADGGYSSGEALAYLHQKNIDAYIPNFGQYKPNREGFIFHKEANYYHYQCIKPEGHQAKLLFKGEKTDSKGYAKRTYRSSESDCKNCPLRAECCGKSTKFKKIDDSIHKEHYDRMHQKLTQNSDYAKKNVSSAKQNSRTRNRHISQLYQHETREFSGYSKRQ